jgi:hypothetical protein
MKKKEQSEKKKLKPLKERVNDAIKGTGGKRGSSKVNEDGMNAQQEKFCELYASNAEFFGNGTQSYITAYDVKVGQGKGFTSYDTCRYRAHELLTNHNVLKRIDQLLEAAELNDTFVDKQLGFLVAQNAEFRPKLGAIQEYNKLKKRTVDTMHHIHAFSDIKNLSDKELEKEKEKLNNFFKKK